MKTPWNGRLYSCLNSRPTQQSYLLLFGVSFTLCNLSWSSCRGFRTFPKPLRNREPRILELLLILIIRAITSLSTAAFSNTATPNLSPPAKRNRGPRRRSLACSKQKKKPLDKPQFHKQSGEKSTKVAPFPAGSIERHTIALLAGRHDRLGLYIASECAFLFRDLQM